MKAKVQARRIVRRTLPTYQVGGVLYKSLYAAARAEAWAMICAKYCADFRINKLSDVKRVGRLTCECEGEDSYGCMIHSREDGYFCRVHRRLFASLTAKMTDDAGIGRGNELA